jgi:hypothetical protein
MEQWLNNLQGKTDMLPSECHAVRCKTNIPRRLPWEGTRGLSDEELLEVRHRTKTPILLDDGHFVRWTAVSKLYGLRDTRNKTELRKVHSGELYDSYPPTNIALEIRHIWERRDVRSKLEFKNRNRWGHLWDSQSVHGTMILKIWSITCTYSTYKNKVRRSSQRI